MGVTLIEVKKEITKPVEEVFAFVSDPAHDPKWRQDVLSAELIAGEPGKVGASYRHEVKMIGRRTMQGSVEVTESRPNDLFACRVSGGPFPVDLTFKVENLGGRSGLTVSVRFEGGAMGKIVAPKIRREVERDVTTLKELLEADPPGGAA